MKNVYFKEIKNFGDKEAIINASNQMLNKIVSDEKINMPATMPLKVHFGEKGNTTFIRPEYYVGVKRFLKDSGVDTCYIETNVLYKGSRTCTKDHLNTAKEHGFTDLQIVIADGDNGSPYNEIQINKKHFSKCKIGKRYADYDGFMVLAHFKGHVSAGFGGAIKQLGMGFAARGGKLHQHSESVPIVSKDKCVACNACVTNCPVGAITIDKYAKIDTKTCVGCAACSTTCQVNAISNDWGGSDFLEKLAEYAYAAALGKQSIYVTFAGLITQNCDCVGHTMPTIAKDIGVFVSTDPVAIDTAALDILDGNEGKKMFTAGRKTLEYAEKIGLGSMKYNLVRI